MKFLYVFLLPILLVLAACGGDDTDERTIRFGDDVLTESEYAKAFKDNPEQCAQFRSMTSDQMAFGALVLVQDKSVPDRETAMRFIEIAQEACKQ